MNQQESGGSMSLGERILVLEYQAQVSGLALGVLKYFVEQGMEDGVINAALNKAADMAEQIAVSENPAHAEIIRRAVHAGIRNLTRPADEESIRAGGAVVAPEGPSGAN